MHAAKKASSGKGKSALSGLIKMKEEAEFAKKANPDQYR